MKPKKLEELKHSHWRVDLKWVSALVLIVLLTITLPVIVAYQLTAKESATKLISYTLAGMTSPNGIDSSDGLEEVKQRIAINGSETIKIAGVSVTFTAEDVNTLSPRELRLKVFSAFSNDFYDLGAKGFAEKQGYSGAEVDKFEKDASIFSIFTLKTHNLIGTALAIIILVDLVVAAGLLFFSFRFGKFISLGLVLMLVGLPGLLFMAIAKNNSEVIGAARTEAATSISDMIGGFVSFISPLIVPYFANTYVIVLLSGLGLLLVAALGRIAYKLFFKGKKVSSKNKPASNILR